MKKLCFFGIGIGILLTILTACSSRTQLVSENTEVIEVVTVGQGSSKEQALESAFRTAVRDAFGVYISSEVTVENRRLLDEQILSYSKGYVVKYNIEKDYSVETSIIIVRAHVAVNRIRETTQKLNVPSWDETIKDFRRTEFNQKRLQDGVNLMNNFLGDRKNLSKRAYKVEVVGYNTEIIEPQKIYGHILLKIKLNRMFWSQYEEILSVLYLKNKEEDVSVSKVRTFVDNQIWGKFSKENMRKRDEAYYDSISSPKWRKARKQERERDSGVITTKEVGIFSKECSPRFKRTYSVPEVISQFPVMYMYVNNDIVGILNQNSLTLDSNDIRLWLAGTDERKLLFSVDESKMIPCKPFVFDNNIVVRIPVTIEKGAKFDISSLSVFVK